MQQIPIRAMVITRSLTVYMLLILLYLGAFAVAIRIDDGVVEKLLRDAREKGLNDAGLKATALCQQEAPVRTGNLRRNIQFERATGPMRYVRVNFNAPYSAYVILGTRYQSANDFPHRALDRMRVA